MTETRADNDHQRGNDALASLPSSVRAAQTDFAQRLDGEEPELIDTNSILHGSQASLGKAAFSAGRMATAEGPIALYMRTQQVIDAKAAEEARQLARLAEWNAAKTVVGGVEMTNAEAQDARQHVVDHGDAYADQAVRQGHIRADEKEEFKAAMRRKIELEDRRGRGILTPAEEREAAALDKSGMGHALDAATAEQFQAHQLRGSTPELTGTALSEADQSGAARALDQYTVFKSALGQPPVRPESTTPIAARVRATGLDL